MSRSALVVISALTLLVAGRPCPANAQMVLDRSVVANGGAAQSSPDYLLGATCGQAGTGIAANVGFRAEIGFWHALAGGTSATPPVGDDRPDRFDLTTGPTAGGTAARSIRFTVPHRARIHIALYSVTGRMVWIATDGEYPTGHHQVELPAAGWPSGIYFCRLTAERFVLTRKLLWVR